MMLILGCTFGLSRYVYFVEKEVCKQVSELGLASDSKTPPVSVTVVTEIPAHVKSDLSS